MQLIYLHGRGSLPYFWEKSRWILSLIFFVCLAYSFNPFPLDNELYSVSAGGGSIIKRIGYLVLAVFYVVTAAYFIVEQFLRRGFILGDIIKSPWLMAFLLFSIIGCLWSPIGADSLYNMISAVALVGIIFALTSELRSPDQNVRFLFWVLFVCVTTSVAGVFAIPARAIHQSAYDIGVVNLVTSEDLIGAWRSGFFHKNYGAGFLMLGIPLLIPSFFERMKNPICWIFLALTILFIFFSRSDTSMMAPIMGAVIAIALNAIGRVASLKIIAYSFVTFLAAVPFLCVYVVGPQFDLDFDGRMAIWTANIQLLMEHPFFGSGTGGVYSGMAGLDKYGSGYIVRVGSHSHNGFMEVAGQLGFAGLALVTVFLGSALSSALNLCKISRGRPYYSSSMALLMCLCAALVRVCLEPDLLDKRLHWFIIIFLSLAVQRSLSFVKADPEHLTLNQIFKLKEQSV